MTPDYMTARLAAEIARHRQDADHQFKKIAESNPPLPCLHTLIAIGHPLGPSIARTIGDTWRGMPFGALFKTLHLHGFEEAGRWSSKSGFLAVFGRNDDALMLTVDTVAHAVETITCQFQTGPKRPGYRFRTHVVAGTHSAESGEPRMHVVADWTHGLNLNLLEIETKMGPCPPWLSCGTTPCWYSIVRTPKPDIYQGLASSADLDIHHRERSDFSINAKLVHEERIGDIPERWQAITGLRRAGYRK